MNNHRFLRNFVVGGLALAMLSVSHGASAQTAPGSTQAGAIPEIIVTAQKRQESVNTVPITITAATGDTLRDRNIESVSDLPRLVPGFTIQSGAFASTSFTLRGVGFFNSDLATPPAVTVYTDEAPLPYPAEVKLAAFDLERVEVLKGPQGTLFGQNATGGLVNYIAAKPTDTFQAGIDASFGRFNRFSLGGFASGPLNDKVRIRLAVQGEHGDPWQYSITRPNDHLGRIRTIQSRGTIEADITDQWKSRLTFTFTHDGSDSQAVQLIGTQINIPALAVPGLSTFPIVLNPRSADWSPNRYDTNTPFPYGSDNNLFQVTWRNEYQVNDAIKLTSLTSYTGFRLNYGSDDDGTPFHIDESVDNSGRANTFFQELRLSGKASRLDWLLGANYEHDLVTDNQLNTFRDKDVCDVFTGLNPDAYCDEGVQHGHMVVNTYGLFARAEYHLTDELSAEGSLRYNMDRRTFDNCGIAVTTHHALFFDYFEGSANGGAPVVPIQVGVGCFVLDPATNFQPVMDVHKVLNENSLPWRVGLNWKPVSDTMFYATASRGFKAGTVPVVGAATTNQFAPVKEESVIAYEGGVKSALMDHHIQLNGAFFYYHYRDKQLRGSILDPAFGPLEALVSIPVSHVIGGEAQLIANPFQGFVVDTSLTYSHTNIDQFVGFDSLGGNGSRAGTQFPFSPKWQWITNIDYKVPVSDTMDAFIGGSITYNSKTFAGIGEIPIQAISAYTLFDVRGGVEFGEGRYRIWAWGKNITNKYYWSNVFAYGNTITRYAGQPATYGVSVSYRFR
jgi:outer membrane receptor protein involved in Fe transport